MTDDVARVEDEVYAIAAGLKRAQWYTSAYRDFERLLELRRERPGELQAALNSLRSRVEGAWESYRWVPVAAEERTAETVVGHKILLEGLEGWLEALEICGSGVSAEIVLEAAEEANRLLVAVQIQAHTIRNPWANRKDR